MSGDTVISAFSAEHVTRITGLTARQLSYWDGTGFFKPTLSATTDGTKPIRVYSFNDVVGLRVIAVLRNEHRISIQRLREVARKLATRSRTPWSSLELMVCKGEVSFIEPETGRGREVMSGQYVLMPIIDQIRHVREAATSLSERRPDQIGVTEKHRNVVHNARVFAGTRVPVRAVERFLAAGFSAAAIMKEYPSLKLEDIEAIESEIKPAAA